MSIEFISGNIAIRQMVFEKAGDVVSGHAHNFDHTTYCAKGKILVERLQLKEGVPIIKPVAIPNTEYTVTNVILRIPGMPPAIFTIKQANHYFGSYWINSELFTTEESIHHEMFYGQYSPEDFIVEKSVQKDASLGFNWVLIKAGVWHRITCLSEEGALGHCIYPHRDSTGQIVEVYEGWLRGYT